MYRCCECGCFFDEPRSWLEDMGEHFGTPCYEMAYGCPECSGEYEEAVRCEICSEWFTEDCLNGGVCDKCFDEHRADLNLWLKIGQKHRQRISINSFIQAFFTDEEIDEILTREIVEAIKINPSFCGKTIDEDRVWWGEKLVEEVEK